jgi:hypothetical protein
MPPQNLPFSFFSLQERCPGFLIFALWLGSCGIVLVIATRLARYGWLAHILDIVNLLLSLVNSSSPAKIDDFR